MRFLLWVVAVVWSTGAMAAEPMAAPDSGRELVVVDEDWNIPGDFICEDNLPLLLASPRVRLLALTAVTGDAWRDEGGANVLRFLEEIGRTDIPVAKGAVFPLVNTPARLAAWEKRFGALEWKGAWNSAEREKGSHPEAPFALRLAREGAPRHHAVAESAPDLLVRLVHAHPHEITIISGGPMTNLALAVRKDPGFAALTRRLIVGDMPVHDLFGSAATSARRPGFNEIFDPEAAHLVLTAGWPEIVCLVPGDAKTPLMDHALLARIQEHPTPASNFLARNTGFGTPIWATGYACVADPAVITAERHVRARLDVDCDARSPLFGCAVLDSAGDYAGPAGGVPLTLILDLDWKRYLDDYVRSLQTPGLGEAGQ